MNWKQKLEELGMTEQSLSASIKKKIKEHNEIIEALKEASNDLRNAGDDDDTEELRVQISELKDGVEASNEQLIDSIVHYHKNKDVYKAKVERMQQAKKNKQSTQPKADTTPAVVVNQPQVQAQPQVQGGQVDTPKDEKKSNFLAWALGAAAIVIVGVVTLGRVRGE